MSIYAQIADHYVEGVRQYSRYPAFRQNAPDGPGGITPFIAATEAFIQAHDALNGPLPVDELGNELTTYTALEKRLHDALAIIDILKTHPQPLDLNAPTASGQSPFLYFLSQRYNPTIEKILLHELDTNLTLDTTGVQLLKLALEHGYFTLYIKLLARSDALVNTTVKERQALLEVCIARNPFDHTHSKPLLTHAHWPRHELVPTVVDGKPYHVSWLVYILLFAFTQEDRIDNPYLLALEYKDVLSLPNDPFDVNLGELHPVAAALYVLQPTSMSGKLDRALVFMKRMLQQPNARLPDRPWSGQTWWPASRRFHDSSKRFYFMQLIAPYVQIDCNDDRHEKSYLSALLNNAATTPQMLAHLHQPDYMKLTSTNSTPLVSLLQKYIQEKSYHQRELLVYILQQPDVAINKPLPPYGQTIMALEEVLKAPQTALFLLQQRPIHDLSKPDALQRLNHHEYFDLNIPDRTGRTALDWAQLMTTPIRDYYTQYNIRRTIVLPAPLTVPTQEQQQYALLEQALVTVMQQMPSKYDTPLNDDQLYALTETFKTAVAVHPNVNARHATGDTIVHAVFQSKNYDRLPRGIGQFVVTDSRFDWTILNNEGRTPLGVIARLSTVAKLDLLPLVRQHRPTLDANAGHPSALTTIIQFGSTAEVALLLTWPQTQLNTRSGDQNETVLHSAVRKCKTEVVEKLCQDPRVDVNARNGLGQTPLIVEMIRLQHNIQTMLIVDALLATPSIDVNATDIWGRSALFYTAYHHKHARARLIEAGASLILPDIFGQTVQRTDALTLGPTEYNTDVFDHTDIGGQDLLQLALNSADEYVVKDVLSFDAGRADRLRHKTLDGQSVLSFYRNKKHRDLLAPHLPPNAFNHYEQGIWTRAIHPYLPGRVTRPIYAMFYCMQKAGFHVPEDVKKHILEHFQY